MLELISSRSDVGLEQPALKVEFKERILKPSALRIIIAVDTLVIVSISSLILFPCC